MSSNLGSSNQHPPGSLQFRPMALNPPPPASQFPPMNARPYQPAGYPNAGLQMPPPPPVQYHPAMQPPFQQPCPLPQPPLQHPMRPPMQTLTPGHVQPQGLGVPPPDMQPNRPAMPVSAPPHMYNNMMPSSGVPRFSNMHAVPLASATTQADPHNYPLGQPWYPTTNQQMQMVFPVQQIVEQQKGDQEAYVCGPQSSIPNTSSLSNEDDSGPKQCVSNLSQTDLSGTHSQQTGEESTHSQPSDQWKVLEEDSAKRDSSDWREYISPQGKRYYHNKRTRISSWEKPVELMTPNERADASTDWREVTTSDGRSFYFNKVTRKSTWSIPVDIKLARENANLAFSAEATADPLCAVAHISSSEESDADGINKFSSERKLVERLESETTVDPESNAAPESSVIHEEIAVSISTCSSVLISQIEEPSYLKNLEDNSLEARKDAGTSEIEDDNIPEGKHVDRGQSSYESKEEAKVAFRALLETSNIGFDWTWEKAMRVIINDRRYGALKSLGERKQAFNEFLEHKKKKEVDEKRNRQRKAKEDFKTMLQECKDLAPSTRWSKAVSILERDDRFQAVERVKDREDLFEAYIEELKKKERTKAFEEHKRHVAEYLDFLKSCEFIKASSQWRKVQHRLEADERCSRLEKIERLEIFQDYVKDLEMEEEEQKKLRMEEMKRVERRNRDEFRKLLEEHASTGLLTINSHWRDYANKVKETSAYISISSNTSGATAKDLFDDVIEDLEKQYTEDKERVEEAIINQKICLVPSWTLEDFRGALSESCIGRRISDTNMKLIFDELVEFKKEREGKEAKRRKRQADDVFEFLLSLNELTSTSKWEDVRTVVEERFTVEENLFRDIYDRFIEKLKEKEKHKEKRRKEDKRQVRRFKQNKSERERRNKDGHRNDKEWRKVDEMDSEGSKSSSLENNKRSRDRTKRYERKDDNSVGYMGLDNEKDQSRSHRHTKQKQDKKTDVYSENVSQRQKSENDDHWNPSGEDVDGSEEGEVQ